MNSNEAKEIIRLLSKLLAETKAMRDDFARRAGEPTPYARKQTETVDAGNTAVSVTKNYLTHTVQSDDPAVPSQLKPNAEPPLTVPAENLKYFRGDYKR